MNLLKLLNENISKLSSSNFPILVGALIEKRRPYFDSYLDMLNNAASVGEIVNPAYQSAKSFINDTLRVAYEKAIEEKYFHAGRWESLPPDMYDALGYSYPQIHTIGSLEKKVSKFKNSNHQLVKDIIVFLTEIRPLVNVMVALKDKIVKKPKAVVDKEKVEQEYRAKVASHDDVKRIQEKLTEITQQVYDDALAANLKWLNQVAKDVSEKIAGSRESLYKLFQYDPFGMSVAQLITVPTGVTRTDKVVADYTKILEKEAARMTKEMMDHFISKNTSKLSEITAKKNNMKSIELLSASTSRGVVEGSMKLTFNDNSEFTVHNKVVLSYSKYNKPFYRFPTTFHNVILSDGSKMSKPSEESMITTFV